MEILQDALESTEHVHVGGRGRGLHLDAQPGWSEAHRPGAGENIDAAIGTGRRNPGQVALRLEDRIDQRGQRVPGEVALEPKLTTVFPSASITGCHSMVLP